MKPLLQRGKVEPALPPEHNLAVEDDISEPGDRGGNVEECGGEVPQLAGLQVDPAVVAEGRPESVELRLV
jgi:hypothetical protein